MHAAGRFRVAALDIELGRLAGFDPGGAPFARPGGNQQIGDHEIASHRSR
jgi:hypothetical protein